MSLGDVLRQHAASDRRLLLFEDAQLSYAEAYREACRYANLFLGVRDPARPFHVGILMENRPEFVLAELGLALAGGIVVGLNPTRRGPHLARDIAHTDCQIIIKVLKRDLQREKFVGVAGPDPIYWRPRGAEHYRLFAAPDLAALREAFTRAGNLRRLDG